MKNRWILSAAAMLSLAGVIGVGCAAQVDEAEVDGPVATEASADEARAADEALLEAPEEGTASEALSACLLDTCRWTHDWCRCSNTGWWGYCDWGSHHPGCIYCHCD